MPSNDPDMPMVTLKVNADIEPELLFEPTHLSIGDVGPGQRSEHHVVITGKNAATVDAVDVDPLPELDVKVELVHGETEHAMNIVATVAKDAKPGTRLRTAVWPKAGGERAKGMWLNILGQVVGPVFARPAELTLRAPMAGRVLGFSFDIVGRDGVTFEIRKVTDDEDDFDLVQTTIRAGSQYRFTADLPKDIAQESRRGSFRIETTHPGVPVLEVPYVVHSFNNGPRTARMPAQAAAPTDPGGVPKMQPLTRPAPVDAPH